MTSKLLHSCLCLLAWEEIGWAGNRMAVTHIIRVKNEKEGGEWASGDGDKK